MNKSAMIPSKRTVHKMPYYFKGTIPDCTYLDNQPKKVGEFQVDVRPTGIRRLIRKIPYLNRIPYSTNHKATVVILIRHTVETAEVLRPFFVYVSQILDDKYPDSINVPPEVKPEKMILTTIPGILESDYRVSLPLGVLTREGTYEYEIRVFTFQGEPEKLCSLEVKSEWEVVNHPLLIAVVSIFLTLLLERLIPFIITVIRGLPAK